MLTTKRDRTMFEKMINEWNCYYTTLYSESRPLYREQYKQLARCFMAGGLSSLCIAKIGIEAIEFLSGIKELTDEKWEPDQRYTDFDCLRNYPVSESKP
jgi:hypothetical protein